MRWVLPAALGAWLLAAPAAAAPAGGDSTSAAAAPTPVDTLSVGAVVSASVVHIGEPVTVRFAVPRPDTTAHLVGPPAASSQGPVDILASEAAPAGPDSLGWTLRLAFFQTGDQNVSGLPFTLADRDGDRPLRLAPYRISVESILPDSVSKDSLRAIKGPVTAPLRLDPLRTALGVVLLVLAGAGVLFLRRRLGRTPERVLPLEPKVAPETVALRALRALDEEALPDRGLMKEHFARLSLILREYLERRFHVAAVESTTFEIQDALERTILAPEQRGAMVDLLDEADLVKFAKFDPGTEAARIALDRGRRWVEKAAPRPQPGGGA